LDTEQVKAKAQTYIQGFFDYSYIETNSKNEIILNINEFQHLNKVIDLKLLKIIILYSLIIMEEIEVLILLMEILSG
jgi:hypothetical protein